MKSKTLSFNPAIILTNLKRFWWTSALYVIIGFLTGPLSILRTDIEYYIERGREIRLSNIYATNAVLLCFAAVIIGTVVVRYLQNSSSVTLIHAMPFTRFRLYVENWVSGLILLLLPTLINFSIMFGISKFTEYGLCIDNAYLGQIFLMILLSSVTLYTITVMVGMFTGSSIAQIVFTYILNFLPAAFVFGFYALLYKVVYGLGEVDSSTMESVFNWLPITQLAAEMEIKEVWLINLLVTIASFIIGYFVYKFRDLETAGDVISNKILKPIFKYGFTICVMAAGVIYIKYAFEWTNPNLLIYLVFALLGYIIAEMLLRKSFKILDSYKGFIGFMGAFALVVFIVKFDLVGYERRIPSFDKIEAVAVGRYFDESEIFNENYYISAGAALTDAEAILKVMDLHQTIIDEKPEDSGNYRTTKIAYKLKNGGIMQRDYEIKINEEGSNKNVDEKINELYNLEEYKRQTHQIFRQDDNELIDVIINVYRNKRVGEDIERYTEDVIISDKEHTQKLLELMKQSILDSKQADREGESLGYLEFRYKLKKEIPSTVIGVESYVIETKAASYDYVTERIYPVDSKLIDYIKGLGCYLE